MYVMKYHNNFTEKMYGVQPLLQPVKISKLYDNPGNKWPCRGKFNIGTCSYLVLHHWHTKNDKD